MKWTVRCPVCYQEHDADTKKDVRQLERRISSSLRSVCSPPRSLDVLADNYLDTYGCPSCFSDSHRCTCIHDKAVIRAFVEHLKANDGSHRQEEG